jgi:putative FmdB family regulatory protein
MPTFEFKCNKCGKHSERYNISFEEAKKGFICECGGHFEKQFSVPNIVGCNRFIYKPGLDADVERKRAQASMEERVRKGDYEKVGDSYQKRKKRGRIK